MQKKQDLKTHGLLEDKEINEQFKEALKSEAAQINLAIKDSPFKDEELHLYARECEKTKKESQVIVSQITEDSTQFRHYNNNANIKFIETNTQKILHDFNHDTQYQEQVKELQGLREYVLNEWRKALNLKRTTWQNEVKAKMQEDFRVRMQAWFDSLLEVRKLAEKNKDLFGKNGLFGDIEGMMCEALDVENLGDLKYQKQVLEGYKDIADIGDMQDEDNNRQKGMFGWDMSVHNPKRINFAMIKEYANKIKNNKPLMDICDLLGREAEATKEMYIEKTTELVAYSFNRKLLDKRYKEEIVGVTLGNDLENLIPQEFTLLDDPDLELLFDLKYIENRLFCFEKQGYINYEESGQKEIEKEIQKERKKEGDKGPIIICVDTSGSMSGTPEITAKAITLTLTAKARKERRNCFLINFSTGTSVMELSKKQGILNLTNFLSLSFGGGTDVGAGLAEGVKKMGDSNYANADLLCISDGDFGSISQNLANKMQEYRKKKNRFYLLDINGHSGVKQFFDKHWVYNSNTRNVRVLAEMKSHF